MDPEQALAILDQMAARAPGSRADHVAAQQAVAALTVIINQPEPDSEPVPESRSTAATKRP